MSTERSQFEIDALAESLLNQVIRRASILPEGVGISIFCLKADICERNYLFLTKHGLVEQRHEMSPPDVECGMQYDPGRSEYPVDVSYRLIQRYLPNDEELQNLESTLHQLEAIESRTLRRK
jgi:hypothetical protein